jgi:hypothetical protein
MMGGPARESSGGDTMSLRGFISPVLLVFLVPLFGGCHRHTHGLTHSEVEFLSEDVIDLMTVVFQGAENAFVGDTVELEDITDMAGPGNNWTVTYDLPVDVRIGLGVGFGRVALRVSEDGTPDEDPLDFDFGTTDALVVELDYELRYEGQTAGGRITDVDLIVFVTATRMDPGDPFLVEYFVDGFLDIGVTFCDIVTRFRSVGRPRDGIEVGFGDGEGIIDDPEVYEIFDYDLDWIADGYFRAEGEVGHCCFFEEIFFFDEVL